MYLGLNLKVPSFEGSGTLPGQKIFRMISRLSGPESLITPIPLSP